MKIISHNVRVWTRDRDKTSLMYWRDRMQKIHDLLECENPDVICFQELLFPANRYIPKGYRRVWFSVFHPIYVRKGIKTKSHRFHFRWESVELKNGNNWMQVINVHLHWNASIFNRCIAKIKDNIIKDKKVVVCGDFNNGYETVLEALQPVLCTIEPKTYTFENAKTHNKGIIDFFSTNYISLKFDIILTDLSISDHRPIVLNI